GSYQIIVTVHDETGADLELNKSVKVVDATLYAVPAGPQFYEGVRFLGPVVGFLDSNPNGQLEDFSAELRWGDGTPDSAEVTVDRDGTFWVEARHTYATIGPRTMTVIVRDVGGGAMTYTQQISVDNAELIPTAVTTTATEGATFTSAVVATFLDANTH